MFGFQVAITLALSVIIPLLVGFFYFKRLSPAYQYIVFLLAMRFISELLLVGMMKLGLNNLVFLHFYAPLEILLLSMFYLHLFRGWNSEYKRIIWIATFVVTGISLVYSAVGNNVAEFNSFPRALESIYFTGLSIFVFYESITDPDPMGGGFYIVNGSILFYFSTCFLVFAFSKYVASNVNNLLLMSNVHSIVIGLCNFSFALGLWKVSKQFYSPA